MQPGGWLQRIFGSFTPHVTEDVRGVVDAAWALRVSEFNLFRLAYRRWYGGEPDIKWLEQIFAGYMFRQQVPPWVRQFCREVLARASAGALDRRAFGADTVPRREPAEIYPRRFIAITMVVMVLAYLVFVWLRSG